MNIRLVSNPPAWLALPVLLLIPPWATGAATRSCPEHAGEDIEVQVRKPKGHVGH